MAWLTQTQRFLQLDSPLESALALTCFSGIETLSKPFNFALEMVSENSNINPTDMLGKQVTVTINTSPSEPPRYFNGYIQKFTAEKIVEGTRFYRAQMQPWLSFLDFTSDCRVFQQKSIPDILHMLFTNAGFTNYNFSGLSAAYKPREYCIQYRETALYFISRLLQESGIFYYFKHENNKHTLMLGDSPGAIKPAADEDAYYTAGSHKNKCITRWTRGHRFYSGKVTHTDYNHQTPDTSLQSSQQSSPKYAMTQDYERYHYPGLYQDSSSGKSLAQQQFEAIEAQYDTSYGESNYASFGVGTKFTFVNPPNEADQDHYAITSMTHHAADGSYLHGDSGGQSYHNQFSCIPAATPFRPIIDMAKPTIQGAQTALVVGSPGEELETNDYGQVKVQFHWDRKGKKDEYSSCWVRVAQLMAGKNWGAVFMPRIGQEVLVHFLEGDPDRPVIMGTVYNGDNLPPYVMPGEQTISGIRTSSTKDAGPDEYNELRFEDNKGSEELFIQAQKDFNQMIKNDLSVKVQNDHSHATTHDSTVTVGNNYNHSTGQNATINVGNDYHHDTAHDASLTVGDNLSHTIGKNAVMNVGNDLNQSVQNNLNLNIGNTGLVEANQSLTLRVGGNSLLINEQGIFINGIKVKINQSS